jgi:hypothetical protein
LAVGEHTALAVEQRGKKTELDGRQMHRRAALAHLVAHKVNPDLASIIEVDLQSDLFTYAIDEVALTRAERNDGKLLLVTNTTDLDPAEVIARDKSLADIERGFRVLKSEIEIAPVFHRLPDRIGAHALICFMALVLYRVLRMQLKAADSRQGHVSTLTLTISRTYARDFRTPDPLCLATECHALSGRLPQDRSRL